VPASDGQPVLEMLAAPVLAGAVVLAGHGGLSRSVERLNVMEVPDILPWVKPHEFLLTTAYPLRGRPETLPQLIADLDDAGLAGIGIKLGRYLDDLPPEVLAVAETRGFPVVQLPDGVGFDEILNEVLTGILNRQAAALARSERIHRAFLQLVLRGHGLPEIVRDLAELLDAPTAIVGPDGRVLAHAGHDPSPASRRDLPGPDVPRLRDAEVTVTTDGVLLDGRALPATSAAIMAGLRHHGHVIAFSGDQGPTADLQVLETAATVAALALTKQAEVQAVEDKYRSDLMYDLLRGVDDPDDVLRRAAGFGWQLDRRQIVLVLRLDEAPAMVLPDGVNRRVPLAATVQRAVLDRDPGAAVVRFSQEVVIVTAAFDGPDGRADARGFVRSLAGQATRAVGGSVSAGMSRPVTHVEGITGAYDQAARAMTIGRDIHGDGAVVHFDDLGAHRILALVEDRAELHAFVDEVLGELAADTDSADDLRRTLEVVLETGGNVAEAARRLHFHYNTLRYRIDKLQSILGPFTTDARIRLDVQLALLARSLRLRGPAVTPSGTRPPRGGRQPQRPRIGTREGRSSGSIT
jgi:PucR family transcriptional regulator, purine catabolism regulatory protein